MKSSLLIVEDDSVLNRLLTKELGKAGYDIESAHSWAEARERIDRFAPDLVLLDFNLPDASDFTPLQEIAPSRPVVMLTAYGSVHQAVQAMHLGAVDYLIKPVNLDELELVIERALERTRISTQKAVRASQTPADDLLGMVGQSAAMQRLRQTIREVAASDVTVLIQGESGSGKELVAQALHAASPRKGEGFVPVDCCTLQETLFESELFGYERGAFTGADRRKPGLIEAAARGTLFFDEIGEAGPAIQAKLLRVLEAGRFRRVGANADLRTDARIVAATNRNLSERVRDGHFREDLYYRLSAFVIHVPPLRERGEDIAALAQHFVDRRRQTQGLPTLPLASAALASLAAYHWPGNVRELRNVIERALIHVGAATSIGPGHLGELGTPAHAEAMAAPPAQTAAVASSVQIPDDALVLSGEPTLEHIEREYLIALLRRHEGNRRKVADALGISERTAYRMIDRYGLK
ncbi:MAG: sigma-54 dependent transcriptional regulator [Burkholderiaceae bacterium]|jgi:DNA-binding NtrC family response regulator|nr:sigma-54 dependent transcriptional regulator [Burkholderiaceae bacterium]